MRTGISNFGGDWASANRYQEEVDSAADFNELRGSIRPVGIQSSISQGNSNRPFILVVARYDTATRHFGCQPPECTGCPTSY